MFLSNLLGVPIPHYADNSNGPAIIDVHSLEEEQSDSVLHSNKDVLEIDAEDNEEKYHISTQLT